MNGNPIEQTILCCPLCGSQEYLLSESDSMLCAECGSFFESVSKITPAPTELTHRIKSIKFISQQCH